MTTRKYALIATVIAGLTGLPSMASAQLIGDKDCFGTINGSTVCPATFPNPLLGTDGRSGSEFGASNGAQQTDFYSANFGPLPTAFNLTWTLPSLLSAGTSIEYRTYGLESTKFSPFVTAFNDVVETGFLDFQDGLDSVNLRTMFLSAGMISRANLAGSLTINIDRGTSGDAVAFDYFELKGVTTVTPEPGTDMLMAAGLLGVGVVARRRRKV